MAVWRAGAALIHAERMLLSGQTAQLAETVTATGQTARSGRGSGEPPAFEFRNVGADCRLKF